MPLIRTANFGESLFYTITTFLKPPKSDSDLLEIVRSRGLVIPDEDRFLYYLRHIGYYRLTGYMFRFQHESGSHNFHGGTDFDDILNCYLFDKKLRFLILEVIERIEVSVRANIGNKYALEEGANWYEKPDLFENTALHNEFIATVKKNWSESNERFARKFKYDHGQTTMPPSWMVLEIITLGNLSSIYENLKDGDLKKQVALEYGMMPEVIISWLKSLNFVRNCCAHHSRLWDRSLTIKPKIPRRKKYQFISRVADDTDKKIYGFLLMVLYLLSKINPNSKFKNRIHDLIGKYPSVPIKHMGFPADWKDEPLWSKSTS